MWALILGLILFLGPHSVRIVAPAWREARLAEWGEKRWKLSYTALAVIGLLLIIWGYGQARLDPHPLWATPRGMNHLAGLLMLPSLILLAASHVPRNHFKAKLHHPMLLSVKLWAFGHLLANNTVRRLPRLGDPGFPFGPAPRLAAAARGDRQGDGDLGGDRRCRLDRARHGAAPADHRRQPLPVDGMKKSALVGRSLSCLSAQAPRPFRGCACAAARAARSTGPRPSTRR
jgi:hypothetical protein